MTAPTAGLESRTSGVPLNLTAVNVFLRKARQVLAIRWSIDHAIARCLVLVRNGLCLNVGWLRNVTEIIGVAVLARRVDPFGFRFDRWLRLTRRRARET